MAKAGKVWLVGAGPGDPGLLTLKARAVLRTADSVFFDRLVNPGILLWAKPGADFFDVGKKPGGKRTPQETIQRRLILAARAGNQVVRLKGGDPFVFGRGGEEAEQLAKAGVPFEVIPGVTAGVAAPAVEGIPVTHRGISTELVFKIGTRAEGSVCGRTLVGYMAVEDLRDFLEKAAVHGFSPETPAAVISRGTCRSQKSVISTVRNLEKEARKARIRAPAIVVVGGVVGLKKRLGTQVRARLTGQRVILTASESLMRDWRNSFEEHGAEVWEMPMTRILFLSPREQWRKDVEKARWIVLTSGAGVRALPGIIGDGRRLAGKKIAVVGRSTAEALKKLGFRADFIGPGPGSEALAMTWPGNRGDPILHITGNKQNGDFAGALKGKGYRVKPLVAYRNEGPPRLLRPVREVLAKEGADWVVFASGTAAERFRRLAPSWPKEPQVAAIGPMTARKARKAGWKVTVMANQVSAAGILQAILSRTP